MNEKITLLLKLQDIDKALDSLEQDKESISPRREGLRADIQTLIDQFEETKKGLTDAQVAKKNLELDIDAREQSVQKNNSELNNVKTNEAYKALLTQIDEAKKSKAKLEDEVLELMEKAEQFQKDLKEREKILQQNKGELEKKIAGLDSEEALLESKSVEKKKEREAYVQSLPDGIFQRYEEIRRGRSGFVAVVPVNEMICGGCRTSIPPGTVNEAMKGKDIVSCESCSRLLYVPPSESQPSE